MMILLSFCGHTDTIYNADSNITLMNGIRGILKDREDATLSDDEKEKCNKQYEKWKDKIEEIKSSFGFLTFIESDEMKNSDEMVMKYIGERYIPEKIKEKNDTIAEFESKVLDKYFVKDVDRLLLSEHINQDEFESLRKIVSLLHTLPEELSDGVKDSKPQLSSARILEDYKELSERFLSKSVKKDTVEYNNGNLNINDLLTHIEKFSGGERSERNKYIIQFACNVVSPELKNQFSSALSYLYDKKDDQEVISKATNIGAYSLYSKETGMKSDVIRVGDKFLEAPYFEGIVLNRNNMNKEVTFDYTSQQDDDYKNSINDFLKIRKDVFAKDPDAVINISDKQVVVKSGDDISFYSIYSDGHIIPMEVEKEAEMKFEYAELKREQEDVQIVPVKTSGFSEFMNKVRRGWNSIFSRKKDDGAIVYGDDGKISLSSPGSSNSYSIPSFVRENIDAMRKNKNKEKAMGHRTERNAHYKIKDNDDMEP